MADRNIDLSIRKPRRTKGTPTYRQRSVFASYVLFAGAACWTLFEYWGQTKKLKKSITDGKLTYSEDVRNRITGVRLSFDPALNQVLEHMRQKKHDETPRRQSWIGKIITSKVDP